MDTIIHLISPFLNNSDVNNCRLNKTFQNTIEKSIIWSISLKRDFPLNNHFNKDKSRYRYLLTNYNYNKSIYRLGKYTIKRRQDRALLFTMSAEENTKLSDINKLDYIEGKVFFPKCKIEIKKGDIVSIYNGRYIEESIYIFNGEVFEDLDYSIYTYQGAIPAKYCFPDFPLLYWYEVVRYGYHINISDIFLKEIESNIKYTKDEIISHFKYDNTIYHIIGHTTLEERENSYNNYIGKIKNGLVSIRCLQPVIEGNNINLCVGYI